MSKVYGTLVVKSFEETDEKRIIKGIASTPKQDRDGDIMEMAGAEFALPMPFMWQHDHCQPIGDVTKAEVIDDKISVEMEVLVIKEAGKLKDRLDEAWQSLKSKLVKGLSIGFRILEYQYTPDGLGLHILKWEWYELSAVTVGANIDAIITDVSQISKAFTNAKNPTPTPIKTVADAPAPETTNTQPVESNEPPAPNPQIITLVDPNLGSISLQTGE
ncbi:HK97 family phage prohead protease [Psychrobacter sp. 72-O-c]|uniref:HK97 family phage prohead protease n=1 Tax=Psychrobacter sp. 72-O-c TaxID=2774125 RepID=UPI001917C6AB|nr:HK97 family phage prohead protease [Psychrobacter sp. 72-O-c]